MKKFNIKKCPECGSADISWNSSLCNNSGIQDGKLRMHDVSILFYLGCNYCSETLATAKESEILNLLNKIERI